MSRENRQRLQIVWWKSIPHTKNQHKRPGTLETGRCSHRILALKTTQKTITVDLRRIYINKKKSASNDF